MKIDLQKFKEEREFRIIKEKIISQVQKTKGGCWEWQGAYSGKGYGILTFRGKAQRAHRISFIAFNNPIPEGMVVCHKCDNPKCVNPEHLFVGAQKDNVNDSIMKGRFRQMFGATQIPLNSKLTEDQIKGIKKDIRIAMKRIAERHNTKYDIIRDICSGKTFKSI